MQRMADLGKPMLGVSEELAMVADTKSKKFLERSYVQTLLNCPEPASKQCTSTTYRDMPAASSTA